MIKVEHITKKFNNLVAVDDVSLEIKKGEIVSLIGPSGSGKSTVLRCINGLEIPEEGKIYIEGQLYDINDQKTYKELREKMGFVFQHFNLFPNMTVLKNLTIAQTEVKKRSQQEAEKIALQYLERVGLLDKKDEYPNKLSGGQKQRVAIVRSLIMHPEVLLFDEVTAALDPEMVREVLDVMLELAAQGRTMLIVTHEMQFAKAVADRIIFLEGGYIVEDSTPKVFFENPKTDRAKQFLNIFKFNEVKSHKNEFDI